MLLVAQFAVCSQIKTKHINTVSGQSVQLLNVKLLVHHVTIRLVKVNLKFNRVLKKNL
jgi:hypothetical protein